MSLNIASGVIEVSSPAGDVLFGTNTGMIYRAQRVQGLITFSGGLAANVASVPLSLQDGDHAAVYINIVSADSRWSAYNTVTSLIGLDIPLHVPLVLDVASVNAPSNPHLNVGALICTVISGQMEFKVIHYGGGHGHLSNGHYGFSFNYDINVLRV